MHGRTGTESREMLLLWDINPDWSFALRILGKFYSFRRSSLVISGKIGDTSSCRGTPGILLLPKESCISAILVLLPKE